MAEEFEFEEEKEFTDKELAQIDTINVASYNAICEILGQRLAWDMEWIGEVSDILADFIVDYFGEPLEKIYPYREEE